MEIDDFDDDNWRDIVHKNNANGGYGIRKTNGNKIACMAKATNYAFTMDDLTDNTWYMITCVYDGTSLKGYIDGVKKLDTTITAITGAAIDLTK